ncbi:MAG: alpha/beta hydrolase [Gammaproteobacteria bacterium]
MMKWVHRIVVGLVGLLVTAYAALVVIAYLPYDEIPRSELVQAEDQFTSIHGVSIRYRQYGDPASPPLVLLHGFANSLQTWRDFAPAAAKQFYVIAPDMPGYGLSDKPVDFNYRNPAQGQFIADFIDHLELTDAIVGGHSLGGAVAIHTALASPRVTGVLLFNPGILSTGVPSATQHLFFPIPRLAARQFGNRAFREQFLKSSYINPAVVTDQVIDEVMAGSRMQGYLRGTSALMDQYEEGTELPLLEKLTKPTLIIWGAADRNKPLAESEDLRQRIPNSRLVVIDNVGHYVHEEAPQAAAQTLMSARGWLAGP